MDYKEYEAQKKQKEQSEELLNVLYSIKDKNEIDYTVLLEDIKKIIPNTETIEKILNEIKNKEFPKQEKINLGPLIKEIQKIRPIVNIPENKPDGEAHKLLSEIEKGIKDIKIPKPKEETKLHKQQYKNILQALEDVADNVKKMNISFTAGGGTDNKLLQQIADNTDELEIKADQINLNTDELEAKLDTLNQGKATEAKQDEIIQAINNQSGETIYGLNDIIDGGDDTYFGKESKDGKWYFMKIDSNDNFSHATENNNPTIIDYQSAKASYQTLTYGTYNQAFN